MIKNKNGFGENVIFPDRFKLPKMPSASKLLKAIEEREKAEWEKPPDCEDNDKEENGVEQRLEND
ncbi:hypothetical protein FACS1894137_03460 [Spirochaetia bacterium]|nr:hypothetical protein FACS1894137_03460 [Spirochaetia bacterium]